MFTTKKEKLAQYAERVWCITEGSLDEKANKAIEKTVEFFHTMGMKTKLSDYATNYESTAETIVARFEQRGWLALGEKQNITLDKVKEIVQLSY